MSVVSRFIADLIDIEEVELSELERIVRHLRLRCPFKPVRGRFSGPFFINADQEIIMAAQKFVVGQPFTAGLIFLDAAGAAGPGPVGVLSASDPSVNVSLSADGQSANVEMTATLAAPATVTWHDPSGAVPDFSVEVTDAEVVPPPAFVPVSGSFGIFAEGTTA